LLPWAITTVQLASISGLTAGSVMGFLAVYHQQKNLKINITLLSIFAVLLFIAAIGELAIGDLRLFLLDLIAGMLFINTRSTKANMVANSILVIISMAFIAYAKPGILSLSYLIAVVGLVVGVLRLLGSIKRLQRLV